MIFSSIVKITPADITLPYGLHVNATIVIKVIIFKFIDCDNISKISPVFTPAPRFFNTIDPLRLSPKLSRLVYLSYPDVSKIRATPFFST